MSPRLAALLAATAMGAVIAATAGYVFLADRGGDRFAACRDTAVAGGMGDVGGPFTLVDAAGRTVTEADVITKPALVYFGYTFCPDVCPLDMQRNAEAAEILAGQGIETVPVFISIDPGRDTPAVVGAFAQNFSERTIGLTGSEDQVTAASRAYRTYFRLHGDRAENPWYLVDHSTFTYLVLPGHGVAEVFRHPDFAAGTALAEDVAARTACFADRM
ncbi:SCO family protein [Mangrovicoccus algicola]|uniref:SCO family protein n=1 Tax=Mangrovicoccus algicola TaxID=2771008 RepID=A0A8J6ZEU5_9RHOB|nr:SCO family protein [Mangrovicoccus algicola]MBE3640316.1 SCO family protein [Mangrovicoccus algicola]